MPIVRHGYSDGEPRRERSRLYSSAAWRRTRAAVFERAGGACEWCGETPPAGQLDAVHLTESTLELLRAGDALDVSQIAAGCRRCHARFAAGHLGLPRR